MVFACPNPASKANASQLAISSKDQLMAADEARDIATCGCSLMRLANTRFASAGAHDPTPTPYFVLEELFGRFGLGPDSHVLDVGCGMGRALAYYAEAGLPGRMTGIELDPALAQFASSWSRDRPNLQVICGDVLDLSLAPYSHFYLFNPFDTAVLLKFLAMLEAEAARPITLAHMSDNGETYFYIGRTGWSLVDEGAFQKYPPRHSANGQERTLLSRNAPKSATDKARLKATAKDAAGTTCAQTPPKGRQFNVYDHPQHYSIWRFEP